MLKGFNRLSRPVRWVLLIVAAACGLELDNAYIHLALVKRIARGHSGVNLAEFSAPPSSIAGPFLLALLTFPPGSAFAPLLINVAALPTTAGVIAGKLRGRKRS